MEGRGRGPGEVGGAAVRPGGHGLFESLCQLKSFHFPSRDLWRPLLVNLRSDSASETMTMRNTIMNVCPHTHGSSVCVCVCVCVCVSLKHTHTR